MSQICLCKFEFVELFKCKVENAKWKVSGRERPVDAELALSEPAGEYLRR